jgi:hypothetical protein
VASKHFVTHPKQETGFVRTHLLARSSSEDHTELKEINDFYGVGI